MSWDNQGGGGPWGNNGGSGGSGSPWGRGTGGQGGGQTPPDIDEVIRRGQAKLRGLLPKGFGGWKAGMLIALVLLGIWAANGFYRVQPNEEGVPVLLGRFVGTTTNPGLHWNWPAPIGKVYTPDVTAENRIEIGLRTSGESSRRGASVRDMPEESQMITGDENIVDIDFVVFWKISDAGKYLFNLQDPPETVKVAAQSIMRDIIGQTKIQTALTEGRQNIQLKAKSLLQDLLNLYEAGVEVRDVQLLSVDPPQEVIDAFNDVQRARQDRDTLINEAQAFSNDIVPRARGEAAQMINEAQAYESEVVNRAKGDTDRFISIYNSYKVDPDVTRSRIYLETMEKVLSNVNKIIMDKSSSSSGIVPYLPIDKLQGKGTK